MHTYVYVCVYMCIYICVCAYTYTIHNKNYIYMSIRTMCIRIHIHKFCPGVTGFRVLEFRV